MTRTEDEATREAMGYMIVSWRSQGTPAAAAPAAPATAKFDPAAKVNLSAKVDLLADRHRAAEQLRDRATVIRILCSRLPLTPSQIEGCETQSYSMWQLHGMLIDDAEKRGQEVFQTEAEIVATERYLEREHSDAVGRGRQLIRVAGQTASGDIVIAAERRRARR